MVFSLGKEKKKGGEFKKKILQQDTSLFGQRRKFFFELRAYF